jgi:hypothetical protein
LSCEVFVLVGEISVLVAYSIVGIEVGINVFSNVGVNSMVDVVIVGGGTVGAEIVGVGFASFVDIARVDGVGVSVGVTIGGSAGVNIYVNVGVDIGSGTGDGTGVGASVDVGGDVGVEVGVLYFDDVDELVAVGPNFF